MLDLDHSHRNLFHYIPSAAGSVIFILLFTTVTGGHAYKIWLFKAKFFIPVFVGGIFEILGYIIRAAARNNTSSLGAYAMQNLFLLVAPVLFAATIYMTLSKVIRRVRAEHLSIIAVNKVTRIFIWSDVVCFWFQGGAASMQAVQDVPIVPKIGKWVVVAGLLLQLLIFAFFIVVAGRFHYNVRSSPTTISLDPRVRWHSVVKAMYIASTLILIRNIVRVAEYAQGFNGWIIRHEFMLLIFDALPMFSLLAVLYAWHPAELLADKSALVLDEIESSPQQKGRLDAIARLTRITQ